MKRKSLALIVLLVFALIGTASAQNIGENFKAGGVAVGGSGYFYTSLDGYNEFYLAPVFDFYLIDNFAFGIGPYISLDTSGDNAYGAIGYLSYTFVFDPSALSGFAIRMGLSGGYTYSYFFGYGYASIGPFLTAQYFLTPRIAAFATLTGFSIKIYNGYSEASSFLKVGFGIAFYLPSKDQVLIGR